MSKSEEQKTPEPEEKTSVKRQARSPNYPIQSLEPLIMLGQELVSTKIGQNPFSSEIFFDLVGSSSGSMKKKFAGLRYHEIIEREDRHYRLTDTFYRYALDSALSPLEKLTYLRKMALAPRIYTELFDKFAADCDISVLTSYLHFQHEPKFNANSANVVARNYKDTLAFAKLDQQNENGLESEIQSDCVEQDVDVQSLPVTVESEAPHENTANQTAGWQLLLRGKLGVSENAPLYEVKTQCSAGPKEIRRIIKFLETELEMQEEELPKQISHRRLEDDLDKESAENLVE